jgi:hypothetical protein
MVGLGILACFLTPYNGLVGYDTISLSISGVQRCLVGFEWVGEWT